MEVTHANIAGAQPAAVKALARFVLNHGGFATAVIEHLGRAGARIVLIGEDGTWGDYVVSSVDTAQVLCAAAKIDVAEGWSADVTAGMPYRRGVKKA